MPSGSEALEHMWYISGIYRVYVVLSGLGKVLFKVKKYQILHLKYGNPFHATGLLLHPLKA